MNPICQVEGFIEAWNQSDLAAIEAALDDAVIYHNIPMEPIAGKNPVVEVIRGFLAGTTACNWETHHIAANGPIVMTERTDQFTLANGREAAVRVMGTFEIAADGRITHWRDYFDRVEMEREFGMDSTGGASST